MHVQAFCNLLWHSTVSNLTWYHSSPDLKKKLLQAHSIKYECCNFFFLQCPNLHYILNPWEMQAREPANIFNSVNEHGEHQKLQKNWLCTFKIATTPSVILPCYSDWNKSCSSQNCCYDMWCYNQHTVNTYTTSSQHLLHNVVSHTVKWKERESSTTWSYL